MHRCGVAGSFVAAWVVPPAFLGAVGIWPAVVFAQFVPYGEGVFPVQDLSAGIQKIIQVSLSLVGVLALAVIVYGGFKYIIAKGDEREIEEAKQAITAGVIGVLIIGLAYAIVNFVFQALGAGN